MADSRRYACNQILGIEQILAEAQRRWLRPSEICEILRNYQRFRLAPEPPHKPPGGSLFLFDRKTIRYFRKDGHSWRKKKDGKTVREAHEKLKAGSVDVLHCYYAHGEDNENFQRRCYWMLDEQLEHIVLVHYRDVKEGSRPAISRVSNAGSLSDSHFGSGPSSSVQASSSAHAVSLSYASSPSTVDWLGQTPNSDCEEMESRGNLRTAHLGGYTNQHVLEFRPPASHSFKIEPSEELENPLYVSQIVNGSQSLQVDALSGLSYNLPTQMFHTWSGVQVPGVTDYQKVSYPRDENASGKPLNTEKDCFDLACRMIHAMPQQTIQKTSLTELDVKIPMNVKQIDYNTIVATTKAEITDTQDYQLTSDVEGTYGSPMVTTSSDQNMTVGDASTANCLSAYSIEAKKQSDLNKLDSFGRWMNKEIGRDCDDSLMASGPDFLWGPLASGQKEGSSLSQQMQVDADSLGYSLSQEQLFTILDFSPEWAYSGAKTKVLICGTFLGSLEQQPSQMKWCCMFGEVEVPAEVLPNNSLRCQAPMHLPGRVPFYITCSNRLACSEVREFEYREVSRGQSIGCMAETEEEMRLQIRLAKMLHLGDEEKQSLGCSVENCEKCYVKKKVCLCREGNYRWSDIERSFSGDGEDHRKPMEVLIQNLLKDRLCEWLVCKIHEEGRGPNILDDKGQGVIHLAAALGYEWAMNSIIAAGVPPAFRDAHGWTGLHWAAYYGREETVLVLIRLGASPGAVDDPTPKFPAGKTAADVASSRGHKGLAGYLAEADLTSHLSSMTMKPATLDGVSTITVDAAAKSVDDQKIVMTDEAIKDQLSLRGSLAAIRNSAQAAARIQSALRVLSFIQRQSAQSSEGKCDLPDELLALASLNKGAKIGHFSDSLHTAAARIQQKYRSWKGRKEFLNMRSLVVKIQAHVRGHQVRKHYKKVVWSVSIVEKAILRWRRKGTGLRGFRAEKAVANIGVDTERTDDYDFLSAARKQKVAGVEKALARVKSMARSPEARDQYMRLIKKIEAINKGDASDTDLEGRDTL